jgi:hypothetical protein
LVYYETILNERSNMARLRVTDYVIFSTASNHISTDWRVYENSDKEKVIFESLDDKENLYCIIATFKDEDGNYIVAPDAVVNVRFNFESGSHSDWFEYTGNRPKYKYY